MATPTRLMVVAACLMAVGTAVLFSRESRHETETKLSSQLELLSRSGRETWRNGNFRAWVESVGAEFPSLQFMVEAPEGRFEVGPSREFCVEASLDPGVKATLCGDAAWDWRAGWLGVALLTLALAYGAGTRWTSDRRRRDRAEQAAHDLRSPLLALSAMVPSGVAQGPLARLQEIAQNKEQMLSSVWIWGEVQALFEEKQVIAPGCRFLAEGPVDAFVCVERVSFRRALSNLADNAIRAMEGRGVFRANWSVENGSVQFDLVDSGRGMSLSEIQTLGQRGKSHHGGNGLGVYHAMSCAKSWGGSLRYESRPGEGTTARWNLPLASAEPWLYAEHPQKVYAVGAAKRIHAQAQEFSHAEALAAFCLEALPEREGALFLWDEHGVEAESAPRRLRLERVSAVRTRRWRDPEFCERVQRVGMRLIPEEWLETHA